MDKVVYNLSLDLTKRTSGRSMLGIIKGENQSRRIQVTLTENGKPFPVPEECVARIYVKRPNGTTSVNGCSIEGNKIIYDILGSDLDIAGIVTFQIKIQDAVAVLVSVTFEAEVDKTIVDDSAVPSQPMYTVLDMMVSRAESNVAYTETLARETKLVNQEAVQKIREIDLALEREKEILDKADRTLAGAKEYADDSKAYSEDSGRYAATSEGKSVESRSWAVGGTGTRPGEDTNNAKYWSERASEVAKVDIATTSKAGIVKPDGTSISVTADGTISAKHNANLLNNPYFKHNSRGQSSYNSGYTVDRWALLGASNLQVLADGIRLTKGSTDLVFQQYTDINKMLGKTVTLSVKTADGIVSKTIAIPSSITSFDSEDLVINNQWRADIIANAFSMSTRIYSTNGSTLDVNAIKLEYGTESTLANDIYDSTTDYINCITSTADISDGYANKPINFASNENLLDNPWFTVNQRGGKIALVGTAVYSDENCTVFVDNLQGNSVKAEKITNGNYKIYGSDGGFYGYYAKSTDANVVDGYVNSTYTVDRWYTEEISVVKVHSDHISLICTGGADNRGGITQKSVENIEKLQGKTCTFSYFNGTKVLSGQFKHGTEIYLWLEDGSIFYHTIWNGVAFYRILTPERQFAESINIYATKLELGTVSTLALDVAPNYATELMKCQRYYYKTEDLGFKDHSTTWIGTKAREDFIAVGKDFPVQMRSNPAILNMTIKGFFGENVNYSDAYMIKNASGISYIHSPSLSFSLDKYYIEFEASADL